MALGQMRSCKAHCATYRQPIAFGNSSKGMSRMAAFVAAPATERIEGGGVLAVLQERIMFVEHTCRSPPGLFHNALDRVGVILLRVISMRR